jgi:methyltransferase family protein
MNTLGLLHKVRRRLVLPEFLFKRLAGNATSFDCPICNYQGPFRNYRPGTGIRLDAQCPRCGSLERHRLQHLVFRLLAADLSVESTRMLHIAPEKFFLPIFSAMPFESYETADLFMKDVDYKVDICDMPFKDGSYDLVWASHVLEHIEHDYKALREISRILSPGGYAILPVPVVVEKTIEYNAPNPLEEYHVRAPGRDYYDRFSHYFDSVKVYSSSDFPQRHQLYLIENREHYPEGVCPLRTPMLGDSHPDYVPVSQKNLE